MKETLDFGDKNIVFNTAAATAGEVVSYNSTTNTVTIHSDSFVSTEKFNKIKTSGYQN